MKHLKGLTGILSLGLVFILLLFVACSQEPEEEQRNSPVTPDPYSAPATPSGVSATALSSSSIKITWNEVSSATSYKVYYAASASGTYNAFSAITATSYTVSELSPLTVYYFKVSAVNSYGESDLSARVSTTTKSEDDETPEDPEGLTLAWEKVGDLPYAAEGIRASVLNSIINVSTANNILRSSNGSTWLETVILPDTIYNDRHQSLVFNNKLFIVGGFFVENEDAEYYSIGNKVSSSLDGRSFELFESITGLTDGIWYHSGASFNNALWVFGGYTDTGADNGESNNAAWKSTDGKTWTRQYLSGFSPRIGHATTVYKDKLYTTGGVNDDNMELQDVLVSSNGTTWTTLVSKAPWVRRNDHTLVANSKGMYLVGGNGGENAEFLNDVWFSEDGVTWQEVQNIPFAPRAGHASVIKDGYLYVIGGCNTSWDEPVLLSDVWRAYVGGNDTNEGSFYAGTQPSKLTITNQNDYPLTALYLSGGTVAESNQLSSELAQNDSVSITLEQGDYTVEVYDTEGRHKEFSVTIGSSDVNKVISNGDWVSSQVSSSQAELTLTNGSSYPISSLAVFGGSESTENRLSSNLAVGASKTFSLEQGTYTVLVYDTQDRYMSFSVTLDASGVIASIPAEGWTSPVSAPAQVSLTLTNNSTYPLTSLYLSGGSVSTSNRLSSNLAVGASKTISSLAQGTYTVLVYDTQSRYKSFTVTLGSSDISQSISNTDWVSPPAPAEVPKYSFSITNSYTYEITAVYVRKSGTSSWGSNLISSNIAAGTTRSVGSFEAGSYDVQLVSKMQVTGGASGTGAGSRRPLALGKNSTRYPTAYLTFTGRNVSSVLSNRIRASTSNWTTTRP